MSLKRAILFGLLSSVTLVSCDKSEEPTVSHAPVADATFAPAVADGKLLALQQQIDNLRYLVVAAQADLEVAKRPYYDRLAKQLNYLQSPLDRIAEIATSLRTLPNRLETMQAAYAVHAAASPADQQELATFGLDISALKEKVSEALATMQKLQDSVDPVAADMAKAVAELKSGGLPSTRLEKLIDDATVWTTAMQKVVAGTESLQKTESMVAQLEYDLLDLKGIPHRRPLAQYVNIMRGTKSSSGFTRGGTFPAVAVPFGFNFWTPVNRNATHWFYQFEDDGRLIDTITAFAVVHEPSPWIGNRQTLQIMPINNTGVTDKVNRAQRYDRKNETAQAHYYDLTFDNGTRTEITPTDHAASFRFSLPAHKSRSAILFDVFENGSEISIDAPNGVVSGHTDQGSSESVAKLYFYARFDRSIVQSNRPDNVSALVELDTSTNPVVGMTIATSLISVKQAKSNLEQEIGTRSFDEVRQAAKAAWEEKLNILHVRGATEDQKVILYSNLYRSLLYPNSAWENVDGEAQYVSPYKPGLTPQKGKIWVNNGFWDTYRTTWPLYTLLMPEQAGEMLDGFVNAFKDGGWVPRWSGPGYNDSMVATSSDVIFADAYLKGVRNFDVESAYSSMLRNATVYSNEGAKGRKGMATSVFYGYVPTEQNENNNDPAPGHVAWSLEADLNDFGIAQMAQALNKPDDAIYFNNRARHYANLFSMEPSGTWAGGWFRQKQADGKWNIKSGRWGEEVTPQTWGYGYTEGNAWSYAFLAPQDGQGLANLYGGRDKLKDKLDAFFRTAPGEDAGSYTWLIHEMKEALKVHELAGTGEYQHNNQTVHHSIYMYNYAAAPFAGQKYLRDVMDKLYFSGFDEKGNSTGDGYIGDEDNGEQSAWYIFSAMGFYPVSMGRPEYTIGAPYFPRMTVALKKPGGAEKTITIKAPGVSAVNRYIQSAKLDGQPLTNNYISHAAIAEGAVLEFEMGPNPSRWGTGENDVPSSITVGDAKPQPLTSLLPPDRYVVSASGGNAKPLHDRTSATIVTPASTWIEAEKPAPKPSDKVVLYTLTSADVLAKPPTSWTLKGSNDGKDWTVLDERTNIKFTWPRQTMPFALKAPASFSRFRLEFQGQPVEIAEFELLGQEGSAPPN
ncbi:GH92 family glycosyl hydrolase [Phyllobacterium sp. 21LDTY02-6]|uniref:GH92 family glycosyl hydrolase n=1 Tax=Phyllobacterium sp. 21LDTY02-6 TaxID=2944903 RepID=UPI00202260DA|nr:GH92 family glycosyl hydrolase [Phyllobacterium sp. 21LDTY02-6]MCO4317248.1 GH92 family glycosyl hydrolase [Phyllobacterium sp. 21LDTY02-6]